MIFPHRHTHHDLGRYTKRLIVPESDICSRMKQLCLKNSMFSLLIRGICSCPLVPLLMFSFVGAVELYRRLYCTDHF